MHSYFWDTLRVEGGSCCSDEPKVECLPVCGYLCECVCWSSTRQRNKEEDSGEAEGTKLQNVCFRQQGFFLRALCHYLVLVVVIHSLVNHWSVLTPLTLT